MLYNLGPDKTALTRTRIGASEVDHSSAPGPYHSSGCKCAQCYGLAEFMQALTGKDYGLPKASGHAPQPATLKVEKRVCESMTCICPECSAKRAQMRPVRVSQPWEPRRARAA
jgi:hypothetical protein